ncbi:MAG: NAD-dependent epimerase/dehydratase family protein [archaeon]
MRVLVTGSRGFVGRRLVKALEQKGHSVKEFDIELGNDLLDTAQCTQACNGIDAVFHLAAVLDEKSAQLEKVNVWGTENILNAAARQRCSQFIFLSTVGVNAGCKERASEKSPFAPRTQYEKSKAKAEKIVLESQEMLPITIVRSALVLGPNAYWEGIVKLVKKGFPLIGGGKQEWQTIYVDDLVSALLFVLGKKECIGETFIVAEQDRPTLRQLYEEMQKQLGIKRKIKTMPVWLAKLGALLNGNKGIVSCEHIDRLARKRSYDTSKINALGWKAKTTMEEAVKKTIEELKQQDQ